MKRVYNEKISARANESLARREQTVRMQKRLIALLLILVFFVIFFIGNSIITFASDRSGQELHKYYTSVQLQSGDSLWSLSDRYASGSPADRQEFISEVCELNGISADNTLHSGEYLVVSYYAPQAQ